MKKIFILIIIIFLSESLYALDEMTIKYNTNNISQIITQSWEIHKEETRQKLVDAVGYSSEATFKDLPVVNFVWQTSNEVKFYTNTFKAIHIKLHVGPITPEADIKCKIQGKIAYDSDKHRIVIKETSVSALVTETTNWLEFIYTLILGTGHEGAFKQAWDIARHITKNLDEKSFKVPTEYENGLLFRFKSLNYISGYILAGFDALRPISVSMSGPTNVYNTDKGGSNTYQWTTSVTNVSSPEYRWYKKYST